MTKVVRFCMRFSRAFCTTLSDSVSRAEVASSSIRMGVFLRIALAIARDNGLFAVTALGTDGGGIPRNTTLVRGLALVRFGALSLQDLVVKACANPAQMLGLDTKGHLGPGADADAIVVDPSTGQVEWSIAAGQVIVRQGTVVGQGGCLLTTDSGRPALDRIGMRSRVVAPEWLGSLPEAAI